MAITVKNTGTKRELVEAGMHIARCVKMVELGECTENVMGTIKQLQKVNITWELPLLTKVFEEAKGPQPMLVSKEFTVSFGEKANLRKALESWRGRQFNEEELKAFDISVLLGKPCMLNITHKPSKKDPTISYEEISAITPPMKGLTIPPQVNPSIELSYDKWDEKEFEALPQFIKDKMVSTPEYKNMRAEESGAVNGAVNDMPWEEPVTAEQGEEPLF